MINSRNVRFVATIVAALALTVGASTAFADAPAGDANIEWELLSEEDGFITKRAQVSGSDIFAFRGETIADAPISKILTIFLDSSRRKDWVAMFGGQHDLEVKNEMDKVYWIRFNTPVIMSDRDYVLHVEGSKDDATRVMTARIKSVMHDKKGEDDCCVRAEAFGTFYRFEAIPGTNKTRIEVEVHTDPKGWVPAWVVNMVQKKWPRKTLNSLVKTANQPGVASHPKYVEWEAALPEPGETETAKPEAEAAQPEAG